MVVGTEYASGSFQPDSIAQLGVSSQGPRAHIWTPDAATASDAALRIAEAFFPRPAKDKGVNPIDAELFSINPEHDTTYVEISPRGLSRPTFLGFTIRPETDGSVMVETRHPWAIKKGFRATIANALTETAAVVQAPERELELVFSSDVAAIGYADSQGALLSNGGLAEHARRYALEWMINKIILRYLAHVSPKDAGISAILQPVFTLAQQHAPHLADGITATEEDIKQKGLGDDYFSSQALRFLMHKVYMDLTLERERAMYCSGIEEIAKNILETGQYAESWSESIAFRPSSALSHINNTPFRPITSWEKLRARFELPEQAVDPRIRIAGSVAVAGEYQLRQHEFTVDDADQDSQTSLRFSITRGANSAEHGERELRPLIEAQIRQLGGAALTGTHLEQYKKEVASPAAASRPGVWRLAFNVRKSGSRTPKMHPMIARFVQ